MAHGTSHGTSEKDHHGTMAPWKIMFLYERWVVFDPLERLAPWRLWAKALGWRCGTAEGAQRTMKGKAETLQRMSLDDQVE